MPFLTPADRRSVLDKVIGAIDTKFMGPDVDTQGLRNRHEGAVLNAETSEAFETAFNDLLRRSWRQPHRLLPRGDAASRRSHRDRRHLYQGGHE